MTRGRMHDGDLRAEHRADRGADAGDEREAHNEAARHGWISPVAATGLTGSVSVSTRGAACAT